MSTPKADKPVGAKPGATQDKLSKLKKRDCIVGDPDDVVHMDWSSEWNELKNLDSESEGVNHGRNRKIR